MSRAFSDRMGVQMKRYLLGFLILIGTLGLCAQSREEALSEHQQIMEGEKARYEAMATASRGATDPQPFDVQTYTLDIHLDPALESISGAMTMTFNVGSVDLEKVKLNMAGKLKVDQVQVDGVDHAYRHRRGKLRLKFSPFLGGGTSHTVEVVYHGTPSAGGSLGSGMSFGTHNGTPICSTLSEPFGAKRWWPCVDDPSDKATYDTTITVPSEYTATSNGLLVSTQTNGDGTTSYHWLEGYPMSTYLLAVTVTDFVTFSDSYTSLDGNTVMPVDYYVYPEHLNQAQSKFGITPTLIGIYAGLWGEYPFLTEKYGLVEFPWGGAMEHQTLTSYGQGLVSSGSNYHSINAHELVHQWFGDDITMCDWAHIWLNEGFATYGEILFYENYYGYEPSVPMSWYDDGQYDGALRGKVIAPSDDPFGDTSAIYNKGGWVLHMLRHVMGDADFFTAMTNYSSTYGDGCATTEDFQASCEAVYGSTLAWFFQEWVYTPKRPIYKVTYSQPDANSVDVTVAQTQDHKIKKRDTLRKTYIMPIDITLHFDNGTSQTTTVWNDQRSQVFSISTGGLTVTSVGLDERGWILKVVK